MVEGRVALGWIAADVGGLLPECERVLGRPRRPRTPTSTARPILAAAASRWRRSRAPLSVHPLLGRLPTTSRGPERLWRRRCAGATGGCRGRRSEQRPPAHPLDPRRRRRRRAQPEPPPPSRPEDDDIEIRPDERVGIPYPEWNVWTQAVPPRPRRRARAPARREPLGRPPPVLAGGASLVRGAHPPRHAQRPRGRLRPRHRPLRRPLRRHGSRRRPPSRGCSATSCPASATSPPRCSSTAARRSAPTAARSSSSSSPAPTRCRRR